MARALAADPPLLLLDEPFGALDPITRRELQDAFRALQRRLGKTAIFVTHDLARGGARRAIAGRSSADGRLLAAGTPDELAASPDAEVRAFLEAGRDGMTREILVRDRRGICCWSRCRSGSRR